MNGLAHLCKCFFFSFRSKYLHSSRATAPAVHLLRTPINPATPTGRSESNHCSRGRRRLH